MKRRGRSAPEPSLFDLPLAESVSAPPQPSVATLPPVPPPPAAHATQAAPAQPLPLFPEGTAEAARPLALVPDPAPGAARPRLAAGRAAATAPVGSRLLAGAADCLVHAAVTALLLAGTRLMGIPGQRAAGPPVALFLLVFSFFYTVVPLAFWGQTLGMAWRGLEARAAGNRPLTFGQTAGRWLGGLLTLALMGLPVLWALSGRSLSDRLSGSWTWRRR